LKSVYRSLSVVSLCGLVLFAAQCGSDSSSAIQVPPPGQCSSTTNPSQVLTSSPAIVPLVKLSADTFTNATSQHATEVEPDSYSWGQTIIAGFQVGRISGGGAADIGYAISTDGGATWQSGLLPGLTTLECSGKNSAVSDTAVVYDAAHTTWLIASLPISSTNIQVAINRSADGGATWSNPVIVANGANLDKDWITCDNTATSPFYGHCYAEWDDNGNGNLIFMSNSTDGGATWSTPVSTAANASGLGAEPLVQPDGTVIVPYLANAPFIESFSSTDGGASWSAPVVVSPLNDHTVAGGLRSDALPSAAMDAAGNIYVVWQDCSFRSNCSSNDLVMSTSTDGTTWTSPARIPIDALASTVDHFIPGLGIDPTTSGGAAHLGLTYYYYPQANCTASTCALYVGFVSSLDGGATWSSPTPFAGPMSLSWLPSTFSGQMVADYIATSFSGGQAFGVFAVATPNSGSTFDEAIYTTQSGFDVAAARGHNSSAGEVRVATAAAGLSRSGAQLMRKIR
jgi:Neuraminidase (sialidase)